VQDRAVGQPLDVSRREVHVQVQCRIVGQLVDQIEQFEVGVGQPWHVRVGRRGEIVGLKWADLDRSTRRMSVRRTMQSLAGRPVEFDVKTRSSRRSIDLDAATVTELDR
jgi:hypothetical protein